MIRDDGTKRGAAFLDQLAEKGLFPRQNRRQVAIRRWKIFRTISGTAATSARRKSCSHAVTNSKSTPCAGCGRDGWRPENCTFWEGRRERVKQR